MLLIIYYHHLQIREFKSKITVTFWSFEMKFPFSIDWYNFFNNHIVEKGGLLWGCN
jgi:hypothetical protein